MNVALMGSVSSSQRALEALIDGGVEVTGVLGVDESRQAQISDYRSLGPLARNAGIPFHSFVKVSEDGVREFLDAHKPDLLWVIGLSQLVSRDVIELASHGGIGFHPTMLPEGRGRAPIAWTILRKARAGVSLFHLSDEVDAGDVVAQREVPVRPDDYAEDLARRVVDVLYDVVLELAPAIKSGNLPRWPQDHSRATYYERRTPADGLIEWSRSTDAVYRLIRAAGRPYPGAFTGWNGRRIIVWRGAPVQAEAMAASLAASKPGEIIGRTVDDEPIVRTGDAAIRLTQIEVEGGEEIGLEPGIRLGV